MRTRRGKIDNMIETFLCLVCGGMMLAMAMGRLRDTSPRFVTLVGMIALALASVVTAWCWTHRPTEISRIWWIAEALSIIAAASAATLIIIAGVSQRAISAQRTMSAIGGAAGTAAACLWIWTGDITPAWGAAEIAMYVTGQILAAFMLGSVTIAWLLGHMYLTASKMTIAPLRRLSNLFGIAVGLRWAYLLISILVLHYGLLASEEGMSWTRLMGPWLVMSLRIAVGLLATAVFAWMVSDCVRLRSTQSATGILYFASIFVYIGELSSQHLLTDLGLPL